MRLLAVCLFVLNLVVLPLEAAARSFSSHRLFHKVLCSILAVDASRVKLCWSLDNGSGLRELGDFGLRRCLLVVSVRIEDGSHGNELEVAFECGCEGRPRKVEPFITGICNVRLIKSVSQVHEVCFGEINKTWKSRSE